MNRQDIISSLKSVKPALVNEGVAHLAVFGSRARGDARPDSDLDILLDIDPQRSFSLLDLIGIEHLVEEATGVKANAFMKRSLGEPFLDSIAADAIAVF